MVNSTPDGEDSTREFKIRALPFSSRRRPPPPPRGGSLPRQAGERHGLAEV